MRPLRGGGRETDGRTDGLTDRQTSGRADIRTGRRTDMRACGGYVPLGATEPRELSERDGG